MASCCNCESAGCDKCCVGPLGVKIDDHDTHVDVVLVVPGVRKPTFFGLRKNCCVDPKFGESDLSVVVRLTGPVSKKQPRGYLYRVRRLPGNIVPEHCSYRLKNDQVLLCLHKASFGSWKNVLDSVGLDTATDGD